MKADKVLNALLPHTRYQTLLVKPVFLVMGILSLEASQILVPPLCCEVHQRQTSNLVTLVLWRDLGMIDTTIHTRVYVCNVATEEKWVGYPTLEGSTSLAHGQ